MHKYIIQCIIQCIHTNTARTAHHRLDFKCLYRAGGHFASERGDEREVQCEGEQAGGEEAAEHGGSAPDVEHKRLRICDEPREGLGQHPVLPSALRPAIPVVAFIITGPEIPSPSSSRIYRSSRMPTCATSSRISPAPQSMSASAATSA